MNFSNIQKIDFFKNFIFEHLESTGSTNDNLKNWIKSGNIANKLQVADYQTAGRGQYSRKWESEKGQCLLFSFTCSTHTEKSFPPSLTAGIAMVSALNSLINKSSSLPLPELWLKWPNDLWYKNKKLAGILTESIFSDNILKCVIGIGINISPYKGNLEVACVNDFIPKATVEDVLYEFCNQWNYLFHSSITSQKELWEKYALFSKQIEFIVKINDKEAFSGFPKSLTNEGALVMKLNDGSLKTINAGSLFPKNI